MHFHYPSSISVFVTLYTDAPIYIHYRDPSAEATLYEESNLTSFHRELPQTRHTASTSRQGLQSTINLCVEKISVSEPIFSGQPFAETEADITMVVTLQQESNLHKLIIGRLT